MPRNRMIKPDFWNDEKLGKESEAIQLTFIGTWNYSDDYGVVRANHVWLKNQIYPYKENLRLETFSKWLEALEKMGMLIKFTVRGEQYYYIRTFRLHQSVEKPSKTRNCTEEELTKALNALGYEKQADNSWLIVTEQSGNSRGIVGDEDKLSISISKENRAKALVVADATPDNAQQVLRSEYTALVKQLTGNDLKTVITGLKEFIHDKKPLFIEPYQEFWNLFAGSYGLAKVEVLSESRKRKFKTRISEPGFDFLKILEKIKASPLLRGKSGDWKVSFDWILENDNNYAKILNGNYD